MTLESKKIDIAQWILSIKDDSLLNRVIASITPVRLETGEGAPAPEALFTSYTDFKSREPFDLERIVSKQDVRTVTSGDLERISREADIQEPLEALLADL